MEIDSNPVNPNIEEQSQTQTEIPSEVTTTSQPNNLQEVNGLSEDEYKDPNKIQITIADQSSPIVVLFGPPSCGKTMTLIRLTRYLNSKGYRVDPVETFRPSADTHYKKMCREYNQMVNQLNAAESTSLISFMLVRVIDPYGKTICQILEAPGEYYFNPRDPNAPFPTYVHAIKNGNNRKIWCYMVEPNWMDESNRLGYVGKIHSLKRTMRPQDKAVFIFNKIDMTPFVVSPGEINKKEAMREVKNLYQGIFVPFTKKTVFGTSDDYRFIPFQTGDYSPTADNGFSFTPGPDAYPNELWNTIYKLVKG